MGAEMFSESKKKRRIRQSVLCDRQSSEQEIGKIYHRRYQVRKILGEGGMGKVFLALDQKTGKEVAVKIVKDQKQWDRRTCSPRSSLRRRRSLQIYLRKNLRGSGALFII